MNRTTPPRVPDESLAGFRPATPPPRQRWIRRLLAALLVLGGLATIGYSSLSVYIASRIVE